jgi:pimeloyl-ACP methyl ester carboxylesterase
VKQLEPNLATNQYSIFGHSAGAQFIHRFLQWTPDARVKLAVSANAGWYTIPDTDGSYAFSWPYSTSNVPDYNPSTQAYDPLPVSNVTNVLGDKLVVLLGDEDTKRTDSARQTVGADAQGLNRFERGQFFFDEGQAEAAALGVDFGWDKYIVPGVGHSESEMAIAAAELFRGDFSTQGTVGAEL